VTARPGVVAAAGDGAAAPPSAAPARSRLRLAAQAAGFCIGLGLLWWCGAEALKQENREQLARLGEASLWQVAGMVGLTLASLALNGSLFWVALRPVRRLRWADVVAVNVIATLLALLPFKLSVLFRVLYHRTRDRLPILTIGAWFSALAVVLLAVVGPVALVSVLAAQSAAEGEGGTGEAWGRWWLALPVVAAALIAAGVVAISRALATPWGWARVEGLVGLIPVGRARDILTTTLLPRAHEGVRMLGSARAVGAGVGLRLADIAAQTARFLLAASIVGQALPLELAVLAASAYFLIGVLAPTGSLGVREAGTAGVFAAMKSEGFLVVVLTITAAETVVLLGTGVLAAVWLRVDRLVRPASRRMD